MILFKTKNKPIRTIPWTPKKSDVVLAMRNELGGLSAYGLNDHKKGDKHVAYKVFTRSGKRPANFWQMYLKYTC